jgi:hypothetical protein
MDENMLESWPAEVQETFIEQMEQVRWEFERRYEENLDALDSIMDRNWKSIFGAGYNDQEGPSLDQVKEASNRNREMSLNPHVGSGLELIHSYVWNNPIRYNGFSRERRGRGETVWDRINKPINRKTFFGPLARKQRQACFYYDGQVLYAGNDDTFDIEAISIQNIEDDYRNPNKADEIWAYRHSWTEHKLDGNDVAHAEWIFDNRHHDKIPAGRYPALRYRGRSEPIAKNKRMFVRKSNPIVGWAYGTADVQRGIAWAEDYRQAMLDGKKMNAAMASIWAVMKKHTAAGAADTAVKLGQSTSAGRAALVGQQNDIMAMTTAGQAYDFQRLLPLLANFAAGIGVSVVALSMNSGNAGGSYGAAKSLNGPEQSINRMRQELNIDLDREVLEWLGAEPDSLEVWFDPVMDPTERYRAEQSVELRLGTGLYEGEEVKRMHALLDNRDPEKVTPVPEGWLIPNNKNSIELRQIDPNTNKSDPAASASNGGGFTPTQGSGAKTVKSGSGDQKSDDVRTNREALEDLAFRLGVTDTEEFVRSVGRLMEGDGS